MNLILSYAVIAYYLQHQTELDQYLEESRAKMDFVRAEIELRQRDSRIRKVVLEQLSASS